MDTKKPATPELISIEINDTNTTDRRSREIDAINRAVIVEDFQRWLRDEFGPGTVFKIDHGDGETALYVNGSPNWILTFKQSTGRLLVSDVFDI